MEGSRGVLEGFRVSGCMVQHVCFNVFSIALTLFSCYRD